MWPPHLAHAGDIRVNDRGLDLQASRFCRTIYMFVPSQKVDIASAHDTPRGVGEIFSYRRFVMRRVTAVCAAAGIAVSGLAVASPAQAGYYLIRWDHRHLPDLERGPEVQANAMAVGLQGRRQAGSDLLCRDGSAGKDAAAAPLHPLGARLIGHILDRISSMKPVRARGFRGPAGYMSRQRRHRERSPAGRRTG